MRLKHLFAAIAFAAILTTPILADDVKGCIDDVRRDALFTHATVACGTNYMDTPAGNDAHDGSSTCIQSKTVSTKEFKILATKVMLGFDALVREVGIHQACLSVDHIRTCMETGSGCALSPGCPGQHTGQPAVDITCESARSQRRGRQ